MFANMLAKAKRGEQFIRIYSHKTLKIFLFKEYQQA
jgi:hypothetical protein